MAAAASDKGVGGMVCPYPHISVMHERAARAPWLVPCGLMWAVCYQATHLLRRLAQVLVQQGGGLRLERLDLGNGLHGQGRRGDVRREWERGRARTSSGRSSSLPSHLP